MGERIFEQDTVCLAATEVTYGTDVAPTAAANAMRVKVDMKLLDGDSEALEFDAGRGGSKGSIQRNKRITGSLVAYVAGHGLIDNPPEISPLLQMAGLEPTVTADTSVVYAPVSTDHDSATIHIFRGKLKHPMVGARGNLEINLGPDALPKFTFNNITGLFIDPTDAGVFQDADFSDFEIPLITDPASITVMTLLGQAVNMTEFKFMLGNDVKYRAVTNDESVQIVNRKPQVEITFEEPLISVYDWWAAQSTYGALAYQVGEDVTDEGRIFALDIPNLQVSSVEPIIIDGISHLKLICDVVPTARDNDFTMTFR